MAFYIYIYIYIYILIFKSHPFPLLELLTPHGLIVDWRADWTPASPAAIFVKSATVCLFSTPWEIYSVFISPR